MSAEVSVFSDSYKKENWKNLYFWIETLFYFLQGLFLAGISTYSSVRMAEWSVPLAQQATLTALTGIPAYLKMFIGLLSDRVVIGRWGRRKPYLVLGLLITIPSYVVYIFTKSFTGLLVAQTLAFLAWAFADTTLDAMTVDITPQEHDSRMQSYAQGGRYLGMALGAAVVPAFGPIIGWTTVIVIIGLFGVFMPITAFAIREGKVTREDLKGSMALGPMLKVVFTNKAVWAGIFISIFMFAGISANLVGNYVLSEYNWADNPAKLQGYGLASLIGMLGTMIGALSGGWLYKKLKFTLRGVGILTGIFVLSNLPFFLFEANHNSVVLYTLATFLRNLGYGLMVITTYTIIMRVSLPSVEGFTFALMTSVMNVGQLFIAPKVLGATLPKLGITPSLLLLSLAVVLAIAFYALVHKDLDDKTPDESEIALPVEA
jgi:MFS transporter, PAT family, beta-lactamase induction signal transducer AmpG